MLRNKLLSLVFLAIGQNVFAVEFPNAGTQIQQIPQVPTPEKASPKISIQQDSRSGAVASDNVKILVNSLHVTGAHVYPDAELLALTGFTPNRELSLSDLRSMASKITDRYHKDGYFLARAYLPAQDIKDGAVTIAVLEGQFGSVELRNQTNLSDNLVHSRLQGINSGDVVEIEPLESRLLLLSDIPGVNITSTLTPGATVGASDLIVDVNPGRLVTGSIDADNAGNRYTGEYRAGATVNLNNPLGLGDVLSVRGLTSGRGLNYGRASYQMQFGKSTVGIAYSRLSYRLGKEFESADAHGDAEIASVYGSYPLIRSRNTNLYVQAGYDHKILQDKAYGFVSNKNADAMMLSLLGEHRDTWGPGAVSAFSLTGTTGRLDIRTPEVRANDAGSAHTNGHYSKLGFSAMRLQNVTESVSLYGGINGQLASKNLDSSEKMSLGGVNGVRAYAEGEAYGDEGYVINLEARLLLPKFAAAQPGQMQLVGFVDTGMVRANKNQWATGRNRRTLSGAGVGINWMDYNNFAVKVSYARKLGNAESTSAPDKDGRFWVQLVKYF